jgi:predicted oxidoreductase
VFLPINENKTSSLQFSHTLLCELEGRVFGASGQLIPALAKVQIAEGQGCGGHTFHCLLCTSMRSIEQASNPIGREQGRGSGFAKQLPWGMDEIGY